MKHLLVSLAALSGLLLQTPQASAAVLTFQQGDACVPC